MKSLVIVLCSTITLWGMFTACHDLKKLTCYQCKYDAEKDLSKENDKNCSEHPFRKKFLHKCKSIQETTSTDNYVCMNETKVKDGIIVYVRRTCIKTNSDDADNPCKIKFRSDKTNSETGEGLQLTTCYCESDNCNAGGSTREEDERYIEPDDSKSAPNVIIAKSSAVNCTPSIFLRLIQFLVTSSFYDKNRSN